MGTTSRARASLLSVDHKQRAAPVATPPEDIARTVDVESDTELARRLNREGIALINAGRPAQAIAPLERAASPQPRDAEILDNLGYAYLIVGERIVASRYFMRALDYTPPALRPRSTSGTPMRSLASASAPSTP